MAQLTRGGRHNHLGTFATAEEAALAVARFLGPEGVAAALAPPAPEPAPMTAAEAHAAAALAVARFLRREGAAAAADAAPSRKRPAASDEAATHAAKRPAPPPRCYCDRPAVRLGDRFVCRLPDTQNYCTFGREDRMRIVPRFGIPAALAPTLD